MLLGLTIFALSSCFSLGGFNRPGAIESMGAEFAMGSEPWSPDGRYVVVADFLDEPQQGLFRFEADGSGRQRLTEGKDSCVSVSPDGKSIACTSETEGSTRFRVLNADGSERRGVELPCGFPSWSADGLWIATTCGELRVLLVRADGSLWRDIGPGFLPVWSADGTRIACTVIDREAPIALTQIELASPDGGERTRLAQGGFPSWSPDGRWLAFVDSANGGMSLIASDGSARRRLTEGMFPRWSPTGERILFTRLAPAGSSTALMTIRPDGSEERVLVNDALAGRWSPDGSEVAFLRRGSLFVVNADGSDERSLGKLYDLGEPQPTQSP